MNFPQKLKQKRTKIPYIYKTNFISVFELKKKQTFLLNWVKVKFFDV